MKAIYLLILLTVFSLKSFAQKKEIKAESVRTFYYTFSGIQNNEAAAKFDSEISKIQNIKVCKTKVKPEKQMGELFVQYIEKPIFSEYEAKNKVEIEELLKKIIIANNYVPIELKEVK